MQLFCDLDGVLADLETGFRNQFGRDKAREKPQEFLDWQDVQNCKNFFGNLPPMPDMEKLWNYIKPHRPIILTGVPGASVPDACANKSAWVRNKLGFLVPIICCKSSEKCKHCKPGDVLIDDWTEHKQKWIDAGGIWITHKNAKTTIQRLQGLGI